MSDERKVSERYRSLSREEPPRHLDDAILAAARRAAGTRPAPLVVPTGRQRWYFPLAAAAIIVLAVAVTTHVEREQPDPEAQVLAPASAPEASKEEAAKPQVFAPDPKPTPSPPADERTASEQKAFNHQRRAEPKPAPSQKQAAPESRERGARRDAAPLADLQKAAPARESGRADAQARAAQPAAVGALSGAIATDRLVSPEQALQGIADLRRQGRHEEADKALAEFRKRYPDYRISAEMLEKVEKR